jgi:trimeric autotransporter adhesin
MATKILFRRDTAANWESVNPVLLPGEIGIETDTYKFKIGNGSRWNQQSFYAFKVGSPNGVAQLGATGKIPISQIPDYESVTAEVQVSVDAKFSAITTDNLAEGTNLYFTNARAISATSSEILNAVALEVSNRNTAIATAKSEAISSANSNTGSVVSAARSEILSEASSTATDIAASLVTQEANARSEEISLAVEQESDDRQSAINTAISNEVVNRNTAINSTTTTQISEGTNLYFTDLRAKSAVASDIAAAVSSVSLSNKTTSDLAEGTNLYFTNARAVTALQPSLTSQTTFVNNSMETLYQLVSENFISSSSLSNQLDDYVLEADRNLAGGFAGLNADGQIEDSILSSSIARTSDITSAVASLVNSAPSSLDTLGELAAQLANDQSAASALTTLVGTKLDSSVASTTYAPISNPTFTGTVSGVTKSHVGLGNVDNTSDLDKPISTSVSNALDLKAPLNSPQFTGSIDFTGVSVSGLTAASGLPDQLFNGNKYLFTDGSSLSWQALDLSLYAPLSSPTFTGTVSFTNSNVLFADSAITNSMLAGTIQNNKLENSSIGINGTVIELGAVVTLGGYYNPSSENTRNKIVYGTSVDAPAGSYSAGDIYIQYGN